MLVLVLVVEAEEGAEGEGVFDECGCFLGLVGWNWDVLGGEVGEEGLWRGLGWCLVVVKRSGC